MRVTARGAPPRFQNTPHSPDRPHHSIPGPNAFTAMTQVRRLLLGAGLLAGAIRAPAEAQPPPELSPDSTPTFPAPWAGQRPLGTAWLPRLRLDNDAYNFWIFPGRRSDEQYTNGVFASLETWRAVGWRRLAPNTPDCATARSGSGRCRLTVVGIGQDMYTPNLKRPPFRFPDWRDERPYAGWLYLAGTGRSVSSRSARTVDVALGVTGPPALGQVSQKVAHWINSAYTTRATGWETQVAFQPGLQLGYRHSLLAWRGMVGNKAIIDLAPTAAMTLGTVRTTAEGGGRLRLGYNLSHPWDPRVLRGRSQLEYYVSAAARAEYVARDFSLDGSLIDNNRSVTRVPEQREYSFGAGLRLHMISLQWEAFTRSRQYTTGPNRHTWSMMSASWDFYR